MTQNNMEEHEANANTKYKDGVNRNARLIVRNISFKATEDDLRKHFAPFGTVEEVKLLKKPDGRLVGCGFVHFTQVPMANKALAATNKKPLLDRPLNVAWAVPRHKYGENENTEQGTSRNKFLGNTPDDDNKPQIKEETDVEFVGKTNHPKEKGPRINRNARLVVRNVSFKATEESLKEHFQPYGDILEVKLLKKPDGKLVGCAFVHFKNVPMAKKALLSTNMKPFLGRPISVDWAVAKDKYMQHIVNQQLEMQDDVKKEDSDNDDDGPPLNISNDDLKQEVKSESDSDSESDGDDDDDDDNDDDDSPSVKDEDSVKEEDDSEGSEDDDEEESEDEDVGGDDQSQTSTQPEWKRTKLNDAEDGCTVFLTNLAFSVDDARLRAWAERHAPVAYALVCVDKLTEHSKGSGFVKFKNAEDAEKFLALPAEELRLENQVVQVKPALKRENLQKGGAKQPKDNRNLYLVKEGVVVAGTKAAVGVSASDMAKRLALERSKTQMLKNLNRFVSRYRLVVSNLPANCEDARLRRVCAGAAGRTAVVTEARVMRDLRAPPQQDGKHPSKGYGFVMFTRHEDALACLRKLNNNPDIFDKNNRPIVSFSIEDRTALNARKKRLEKSIANNPQGKNFANNQEDNNSYNNRQGKNFNNQGKNNFNNQGRNNFNNQGRNNFNNQGKNNYNNQGKNNFNNQGKNNFSNVQGKNNENNEAFKNRKRKAQSAPDESYVKKGRFQKKGQDTKPETSAGNFVRRPRENEIDDYTGLTAKEGAQHKMRSNHKLRAQADVHRQTVKMEKKKSKRAMRLKMAARERVKQPKQKINKTPGKNKRKKFKSNDIRDILK